MESQRPAGQPHPGMDREALDRAILSLKLSLTAAWAHAQLLERRSRQGGTVTTEQVERSARMTASACADMRRTIREIEDVLNQRGDANDAIDR